MAGLSKAELKALSSANQKAEMTKIRAMLAGDAEAVRAAYWNRTPEGVRKMACFMAGIDAKRGKAPIQSFDAAERAALHAAIKNMLPHLENLMRCATGGKTADHGEMGAHSFDGIAAKGTIQ